MQRLFEILSHLTIPLGKWFGAPVILHWSWVLVWLYLLAISPSFALIYAALFAIVLLHEGGHCLAAHAFGWPIKDVTLYPIGGAARMDVRPVPREEFYVALAGPAVNLLLAAPLWFLAGDAGFWHTVYLVNWWLLAFNMLPAFPMDGGRVLRAALAWRIKTYRDATALAVGVSDCVCLLMGVAGLLTGRLGIVAIAVLVYLGAHAELERVTAAAPPAAEADAILADCRRRLDRLEGH